MGIEKMIKNIIEPHLFELKTSDRINQIRQEISDSLQIPFDAIKTTEWMDSINFVVDGKEYNIKI